MLRMGDAAEMESAPLNGQALKTLYTVPAIMGLSEP